ncbi:MAG: hypothetical protein JW795_04320 [Chitinivibrionales bacterium]|nr:hypothetical protein [Chitinivibrionales bacterium]
MEFDNAWERIKKGLKDGAALSMEKIEEYTKIGKLKVEEYSAKRKIERNYVDIGERYFELKEADRFSEVEKDVIIVNAIENIKRLKNDLVEIEKKIQAVPKEQKSKSDEDEAVTGV